MEIEDRIDEIPLRVGCRRDFHCHLRSLLLLADAGQQADFCGDDHLARIGAGKIWYYPVRTASPRIMPCRAAWSRVASSLTTRVPARL